MKKIQELLVNSYATLVMAERKAIEDVPETKKIGDNEIPIRSEVEIEISKRTVDGLD